jgi:hypothetical protein
VSTYGTAKTQQHHSITTDTTALNSMTDNPHMSPITRMERTVELIEEMKTHPFQTEILELARQQLIDMNTFDVVTENK